MRHPIISDTTRSLTALQFPSPDGPKWEPAIFDPATGLAVRFGGDFSFDTKAEAVAFAADNLI